ncbi:MAG TPA: hypothetical protein VM513_06280 [Kofleriaceae bacterium]|jgi:hypothetical protein|nr:hypothetical protein [Kofleriaceae bacterium]
MKIFALLACALAIGCSDKKPANSGPAPAPTKPSEPTPSTPPTPTLPPAPTTPPASGPRIGCAAEIAIECAAGFQDGCVGDKTKVHICVAVDAKPASACETEIVFRCPEGQIDGCSLNPSLDERPVTDNHVCVLK